jgi:hypothetical protein
MKRLACLLLLLALPATATTLEELAAADKLRIDSWLEPIENIATGQEVRLVIEVSTPRWFAGGTRITAPEVNGVVVLRRNEFALNLSRREEGVTWVVQRWELELYPQREGDFTLPPLQLELAVNDADAGIVRGELLTRPLAFSASTPAAMAGLERWLATPSLAVSQRLDHDLTGLVPGDAFTRTVEIRATHVTSMMLPEPDLDAPPGLAAYPDIPELEDRSNRGEATAIRRQSITYVVQETGQHLLPALTIDWWNTETGSREFTELSAIEVDAGTAAASLTELSVPRWTWPVLVAAVVAGLLALLLRRGLRREKDPLKEAGRALGRGDADAAARALYRWLNRDNSRPDWLSLRRTAAAVGEASAANDLLQAGYRDSGAATSAAKRMLRKLARRQPTRAGAAEFGLNPRQPRK